MALQNYVVNAGNFPSSKQQNIPHGGNNDMKKETNFETSPLNTQETKAEAAAALTPSATNGDSLSGTVSFYKIGLR